MLSGPMRDRFKMHEHLEFYSVDELATIVRINAGNIGAALPFIQNGTFPIGSGAIITQALAGVVGPVFDPVFERLAGAVVLPLLVLRALPLRS